MDGDKLTVFLPATGEVREVPASAVCEVDETHLQNLPNVTDMNNLHEAPLLHLLRRRLEDQIIYTWAGAVLISVNPFEPALLGSSAFGRDVMKTYAEASGTALGKLPPHIFALAERAFSAMLGTGAPQAIVISGESGAGKTEGKRQCCRRSPSRRRSVSPRLSCAARTHA